MRPRSGSLHQSAAHVWGFRRHEYGDPHAYSTHGNPRSFETDRLKDEYLEETRGLRVRRITDTRLHAEPDEVAQAVRRALAGPRR